MRRGRRTTPTGSGSSPKDAREPLVWFRAERGLSFDQVRAAIQGGLASIDVRVKRRGDIVVPGRATEVDDSGILRVEGVATRGVIYLISKDGAGELYGEFF